jgi:hypothetical protein
MTRRAYSFSCLSPRRSKSVSLALLVFAFPLLSMAQSTPVPDPAKPTTPAPSSAPAPQADSPTKPAPPAKPKHVFTNEDLEPKSSASRSQDSKLPTSDNSPLLNCEAACEQEARDASGYDTDREAEWQLQIVQARRDLAADQEWRGMLSQSIQQLNTYCNFQAQYSQQLSPTHNDYQSQMQRAKASQYFQNMDETLRRNLESTFNRMQARADEVAVLSPVRAALMTAQANRIGNRPCELPPAHK